MGIPSYYRKLLRTNPELVRKSVDKEIDWLWMDFNCLIYHCLRRPDLRPYPGSEGKEEWEADFLKAIVAYVQKVVGEVKPTKGVYIGIDGVVPMAKMKQQRMRRFKSSWLVERGLAEGQTEGQKARWDTNAITPGTLFMAKLKRTLEEVARRKKWILSSSDEPGEGEHKVMAQIRALEGNVRGAIYGLDADLIVLSLLTQDTMAKKGKTVDLWLFREQVEEGALVRDGVGEEVFQWFSIGGLRDILKERVNIRDYCFAMSFLGNDFLPISLGLKMREDGHDVLLDLIGGKSLLKEDEIDSRGLSNLLRTLAREEERRIGIFVSKKLEYGARFVGLEVGHEDWPMSEKEELCLMTRGNRLRPDWPSVYRKVFLQEADVKDTVRVYHEGLRWIWDYYRGKEVCYNWYYPWTMPPLWSEIAQNVIIAGVPIVVRGVDIQPVEQLCLVLPPASWNLIPSAKHKGLLTKAPYLFPKDFRFSSVGRRFFWECEAEIPIPSIREVKAILT